MKEFRHIMVDIETLGNKSNSVITQISAVRFDRETGETGEEFDIHLDIQDCMEQGLEVNADTLMWWFKQDAAARAPFTDTSIKRHDLHYALVNFEQWLKYTGDFDGIWGNSARFDLGLLSDAYDKIRRDIPWPYWTELDVRTLVSFKPEVKTNTTFKGVPHNAIDDCKHQINYCTQIWSMVNG